MVLITIDTIRAVVVYTKETISCFNLIFKKFFDQRNKALLNSISGNKCNEEEIVEKFSATSNSRIVGKLESQ